MKPRDKIKRIDPLTPTQEGMFYTSLADKESRLYFVEIELNVAGELDVPLLEQSMNELIRRYDSLRTVFVQQNMTRPVQVVLHQRQFRIHYEDLSGLAAEEQESFLTQWKQANKDRDFDLARDLLLRIAVFRTGEAAYRFIFNNHHIIMDGWSFSNVFRDLLEGYRLLRQDQDIPQSEEVPYRLYLDWLQERPKEASIRYWKTYFEGYRAAEALPAAPQGILRSSGAAAVKEVLFELGAERVRGLEGLARRHEVTVNSVFQTVWALVMRRYCRSDDIVFGSIVSGRTAPIEGIERMVGLLINTVPVRIRLNPEAAFAECLKQVQRQALESMPHDYVSYRDIEQETDLKHARIDHFLVFENFPIDREVMNPEQSRRDLGFEITAIHTEEINYHLTVHIYPEEGQIKFSYHPGLHEDWFIEQLQAQLLHTMDAAVLQEFDPVERIGTLTPLDEERLLRSFFREPAPAEEAKPLHVLFDEQVRRTPDLPALLFEGTGVTYRELQERADRLARRLRSAGVRSEEIVGLRAGRSPDLVAGMLAVWKAGGAFVPVDPDYPEERQRYMLEDSGAKLLLTGSELAGIDWNGETLLLEESLEGSDETESLPPDSRLSDLAYVIYTSGTTGRPKGVMLEHGGAVNTMLWRRREFGFRPEDRVLQVYSFAFDAFLSCLVPPLLSGSAVVLAPEREAKDPLALRRLIREQGVTHIECVPSLYAVLLECLGEEEAASLRVVTLGGEKLPQRLVERSREVFPHIELADEYGPTENSIITTCERHIVPGGKPSIGRPIPGTRVYILDERLRPLPAGVKGHLWIAGAGLARGYLNRPELTAEAFPEDPFHPGERMYRSGDTARWLPDGRLEYTGRMDDQVKIRGYRIELGEIEEVLRAHRHVKDAAVTAYEASAGEKVLCAYYVPSDASAWEEELRDHCSARLPVYMIPAHMIRLDAMPLSANGKMDRHALPQPEELLVERKNTAAQNQWEHRLAALCQELLERRIGVADDFFEAGGSSLKAMMLVSRIHQDFGVELPLAVMMEAPSPRGMASYLMSRYKTEPKAIMLMNKKGRSPLFCFTPMGGLGMIYHELGRQLQDVSVYSIDYIDHPHHMKHYVELITGVQPEGPYVLLGYSSGGHLAFEAAKALEAAGHPVSRLILLDCYRKKDAGMPSAKDLELLCRHYMTHPVFQEYQFREKDMDRLKGFLTYFFTLENSGSVQADIHLIRSTLPAEGDYDRAYAHWQTATAGSVREHQGLGGHDTMLNKEHVEGNAEIIRGIALGSASAQGKEERLVPGAS
ncbi:SrfAC [Paenibacillus mucilaginosus 3016]|uniref:SrfAC n=1 Tax=Paenibacillus mucilaginosus 3016 TaxID=1116391 RepID=H6NMZ0_9BACL|nr:non-ribosomal peptide synthetase [Paenibacillus mucilaginosus]AFC31030.1 SrfAC [Paenibacillus mucilaginosus 3016]WFA19616.1 non-ribosomal peptide synthetase [Paenibacillus mucilaginosus]